MIRVVVPALKRWAIIEERRVDELSAGIGRTQDEFVRWRTTRSQAIENLRQKRVDIGLATAQDHPLTPE